MHWARELGAEALRLQPVAECLIGVAGSLGPYPDRGLVGADNRASGQSAAQPLAFEHPMMRCEHTNTCDSVCVHVEGQKLLQSGGAADIVVGDVVDSRRFWRDRDWRSNEV